jgi:predicted flap endonuclease-1-like 5' DNA nuclease
MFTPIFSMLFEEAAARGGIPWWVWLILIIILLVILWFWFGRDEDTGAEAEPKVAEAPAPEAEVAAAPVVEAEVAPEPEPEAETEVEVEPSDLKKIEGIGPKVASLLFESGILTFTQLAETPIDKLEELLKENKLQMMKPTTWPEQAKLAAGGDWEALEKLQDELQGGTR